MERIILGVSGGVDSSVAGYLLKEQGYEVIGLFMKNWEEDSDSCPAQQDYEDARGVCLKLHIPFYTVNFAKQYWDNVFSYFLEQYGLGRTPNPDVLCNSEIKFKCFMEYAKSVFSADKIATGHYARSVTDEGSVKLLKGLDEHKDQSYFLSFLSKEQIARAVFPLGFMKKEEVRAIAEKLRLRTADKKDSTGICFIGPRNFKQFLKEYLPARPGDIVDADTNEKIGTHDGLMYYTIGQRRGLGIGNLGGGARWFVCGKDMQNNILRVVQGADHPKLYCGGFYSSDFNLIGKLPRNPLNCEIKYRYQQAQKPCVISLENGALTCTFESPQSGVAPGQVGAFYLGDECLGGAVIGEVFIS